MIEHHGKLQWIVLVHHYVWMKQKKLIFVIGTNMKWWLQETNKTLWAISPKQIPSLVAMETSVIMTQHMKYRNGWANFWRHALIASMQVEWAIWNMLLKPLIRYQDMQIKVFFNERNYRLMIMHDATILTWCLMAIHKTIPYNS